MSEQENVAVKEVNFEGVFWTDIDWTKKLHSMGKTCDCCGADGAEGHQNACLYLFKNQQTPRGREFLKEQIRLAVQREKQKGRDLVRIVARKRKLGY